MGKDEGKTKTIQQHGPLGFVFFVAYIGALVYFVQQSSGFWGFIAAFFKALVWPAFVVHQVLQMLNV
jgi:hypothetical protein